MIEVACWLGCDRWAQWRYRGFDYHGHLLWVDMELFVYSHCVAKDALSEVMKVYTPMKLKVLVDITVFLEGRNAEGPCIAVMVLRAMRRDVEENGPKLSITEGETEGKSKAITSCSCLELTFQECST